jgi:uncharacterized protein (TIGR02996 family)
VSDENEAFIRAIVDAPGDDLPRLVYADWLDDRDDPRGAYLRAEREASATGAISRLQQLAAGLDPVWVARVSRPPAGVCFGARELTFIGPPVSERDLDRFEAEIGLPLTADYWAFLLVANGGAISAPNAIVDPRSPTHCFYSLDFDGRVSDRRSLLHHARKFRSLLPLLATEELLDAEPGDEPWFADALPIADSGRDFALFYAVRGKYAGRLHYHDYACEWCRFGWSAGPYGPPTLPQFLHRFPQRGWGLTEIYPSQPLQEFWKV